MLDDQPKPDDDLEELISDQDSAEDETDMSEQDVNAHTLSIRRATAAKS
jgi:hypothetical protein